MIQLTTIQKTYEQKNLKQTALTIKNMVIQQGDFIGITGSSGSGKSTLLNILATLDSPSMGSYFFDGKDLATYSSKELARFRNQEVGILVQFFALIQDYTVFENIQLPLHYQKMTAKEKKTRVYEVAEKLGISDFLNKYPKELSGGQQQRVALGRAIINTPKLILADEPTGNLDSENTERVMTYLKELHALGHTICLVTHELELMSYCNRQVVLKDGKIISDSGASVEK